MADHAYTRATYTNISDAHFTWRGEKSDDGKAWSEFMAVECYRSKHWNLVLSFCGASGRAFQFIACNFWSLCPILLQHGADRLSPVRIIEINQD